MSAWRLLVDGIHLSPEAKGVGLYTENVLRRLVARDEGLQLDVLVLDGFQTSELEALSEASKGRLRWRVVPWKNHLWHGFRTLPREAARHRPAAVWMPYETPVGRLPVPFSMVCHDIPSALRQAQAAGGGGNPPWRRVQHWLDDRLLGRTLRRARTLFSNSHWVAAGLAAEYRLDSDRQQLAPCAPAVDFEALSSEVDGAAVRQRLGLETDYVLTFHTGDPRENHRVVPAVFEGLVNSGADVALVVAGVRPAQRDEVEAMYRQMPWRRRVRFQPFLGADQRTRLAELYSAAAVYLDPSLQEGFGMQVIEAMACGTPVVCSNLSALPEVAGDGAVLVDPRDVEGMAAALSRVLAQDTLRQELIVRGRRRARSFRWSRTADVIYRDLLQAACPGRDAAPAEEQHGD